MKKLSKFFLPSTFLILLFMNACYYTQDADLIIHNAKIYTVDNQFSVAEAMAIKDGKIIEVGPNNEIKNRYNAKKEVDAKLATIYPGFFDAHCHFLAYGNTFFEVNLVGTKSWQEVLDSCLAFSKKQPVGWITGRGWDQNDWAEKKFSNKSQLDSLFPNRAVLIKRIDGHAAIANQKALDLAGISKDTKIEGGVIKVENGKLTGLLVDNAVDKVSAAIPPMTDEQMKRSLLKAEKMCLAKGLTTLDDAFIENHEVHLIDSLQKAGILKIKIYGMLSPSDANKKEFYKSGPYETDRLSIRSFKYFADGALGSRGAKLLKPYSDDPENDGLLLKDSAYFAQEALENYKYGFQMNTHCIGDSANRLILDIYAQTLKGTNDRRWRIEHAQIVAPSDLKKFGEYNIIPSVQPTHATSDMYWLVDRLGEKRAKTGYAYKDLLNENGLIALGTDFPIEDIDPLKTFFAAVFRKDKNFYPKEGFQVENAISREDAIRGMTIWAAVANFEEGKKGSLEKGKDAEFILLNQDLLEADEKDILKTKVISTYINGKRVYQIPKK